MPWVRVKPVWDKEIIGLCGYPYHGHPRGCSNFCKRVGCPPTMVPLEICLDECYFIYIKYHLGKHVRRMFKRHPDWSIYQAQNIYYWQATARKILQKELDKFLSSHSKYVALGPKVHLDSWGIDMTATMAPVGVKLWWGEDWGRQEYTYLLRYAGLPIEKASQKRLKELRRLYPAIYHKRVGRCAGCSYRPCLKYLTGHPALYVKKRVGTVLIQRFIEGEGWLVKCDCGRRRMVAIDQPFCKGFACNCGIK